MSPEIHQKLDRYLDQDAAFRQVYNYTRTRFEAAKHLTGHNWDHARRDVLNSIVIGEAESADMATVLPATVMHDIGFLYGSTGKEHAEVGANKLESFLKEGDIELGPEAVVLIAACIRTHKGAMHEAKPDTLEAKVVSDADMLEKFGPVGVYQSIRTFAEFDYDIHRIIRNLSVMEGWALQTETGRRLAEDRKQFSSEFAKAFREAYRPYLPDEQEEYKS